MLPTSTRSLPRKQGEPACIPYLRLTVLIWQRIPADQRNLGLVEYQDSSAKSHCVCNLYWLLKSRCDIWQSDLQGSKQPLSDAYVEVFANISKRSGRRTTLQESMGRLLGTRSALACDNNLSDLAVQVQQCEYCKEACQRCEGRDSDECRWRRGPFQISLLDIVYWREHFERW